MISKPLAPTTAAAIERFPDFPPRDDMQNPIHLDDPAWQAALRVYFGNSETTLVLGEVPLSQGVERSRAGVRIPDLMVAFDVDRPDIIRRKGYAIDRVGKPPEFVLEVASENTARQDYTAKRRDYERFGVSEYWRFDPTGGEWHDEPLAGDRLVAGRYESVEIEWPEKYTGRGYSVVLGLYLCWENGWLSFYDPRRGLYLPTYDDAIDRADSEAARADSEAARADLAEEENRRLRQRLRELGHASE